MLFRNHAILACLLWAIASPLFAEQDVEDRPKVGLALSGGGARGIAHIGVLKVLEELNVPIDYIAGTSMGSIVGGLYAAGYSTDDIEKVVLETNWVDAFSDQPDRRDNSMRRKELDSDFLIPHRLGFNSGELQLPLGVIEGQQLDKIFQRLLAPVKDIQDFDDLRIPFRAVATDLVTGAEVVLGQGSLPQALRASMAVPGVFAPTVINGRLLVDGGMANNLPINVVRNMGAEIVIAVDISAPLLTEKELKSVLNVTEQLTNFLTRRNTEAQIASLGPRDILIVPDLSDFSSADFTQANPIAQAGYDSASLVRAGLRPLSAPGFEYPSATPMPRPVLESEYIVHFIEIENDSVLNDEIIRSRLGVDIGESIDIDQLEQSIDQIYSVDVFQLVSYELITNEQDETGLRIKAVSRSWGPNYLQFGLEVSDDFAGSSEFSLGVAYTRNALNSFGGELRAELIVGREDQLEFDFYQPIDRKARWFIEPRVFWARDQINLFSQDEFVAEIEIAGPGAAFGVGRNFGSTNQLRLDYEYFRGEADVLIGDNDLIIDDNVRIGEFNLQYLHDSQDNLWFPTEGSLVTSSLRMGVDSLGSETDYLQAELATSTSYSLGKNSVLLNFQAGYSFDDDVDFSRWFELGGLGRLSGLVPDQLAGRNLGLVSLAFYRRLNDIELFPVYAGFSLETGNVWRTKSDIDIDDLRYSTSLFVGADTPLGPFYLAYGYSDNGDNTVYFYLGNPWRGRNF